MGEDLAPARSGLFAPFFRVIEDVFPDIAKSPLIPDDPVMIAAMPDCACRVSQVIDLSGSAAFKPADDLRYGGYFFSGCII